jgi:hypothetical protein
LELFVPGRICLFGEHSYWAGGYRCINGEVENGNTLGLDRLLEKPGIGTRVEPPFLTYSWFEARCGII